MAYLGGRIEERMSSVAVGFAPSGATIAFLTTLSGNLEGDFNPFVSVLFTQTGFSYFTREKAPDIQAVFYKGHTRCMEIMIFLIQFFLNK